MKIQCTYLNEESILNRISRLIYQFYEDGNITIISEVFREGNKVKQDSVDWKWEQTADKITLIPSNEINQSFQIEGNKLVGTERILSYKDGIMFIKNDSDKKSKNDEGIELVNMNAEQTYGTFTDIRDGKVYKTIHIGKQVWMAENLNYETEEIRKKVFGVFPKIINTSWSYNNDPSISIKFGRLYTWDASKKACPEGWHIPSELEWLSFIDFLGGKEEAVGKLLDINMGPWPKLSQLEIDTEIKYSNISKFSALPGGLRRYDETFWGLGALCNFWSSSESNNAEAFYFGINKIIVGAVSISKIQKQAGLSVRCIKD